MDSDLAQLLGTKPVRGCNLTPNRRAAAEHHANLLLQLSVLVDGDRAAVRVLNGTAPCPARALAIVQKLADSTGGKSLAAFSRARRGVSAHGR